MLIRDKKDFKVKTKVSRTVCFLARQSHRLLPLSALGFIACIVFLQAAGDDYPNVHLEISQRNLAALESLRVDSLQENQFFDLHRQTVKASLRFGDNQYDTRVRLKGDFNDHRDDPKKFSLRFKSKIPISEIQLEEFSIQHPKTRGWYWEKQLYDFSRSQGLIVPKVEFVRLKRNGDDLGIMTLEEVYSQQSAHYNHRKEGVFLRFDDDLSTSQNNSQYENFRAAVIKPFDRRRIFSDPKLALQYLNARGLLEAWVRGDRKASEIFDIEQMAKFLAVAELFASDHGLDFTNFFFFYNSMTKLLEPVFFDAKPIEGSLGANSIHDYDFVYEILSDDLIMEKFVEQVAHISPVLINAIDDYLQKDGLRDYELFSREFKNIQKFRYDYLKSRAERFGEIAQRKPDYFLYLSSSYDLEIENVADHRGQKNAKIMGEVALNWAKKTNPRYELKPDIIDFPSLVSISLYRDRDGVAFDAFNVTNQEVIIDKITIVGGDKSLEIMPNLIFPPTKSRKAPQQIKKISITNGDELPINARLEVSASILGDSKSVSHVITGISDRTLRNIQAPPVETITSKFPFLKFDALGNGFKMQPGEWIVGEPIIIPSGMGLEIEPGTKLVFAENAGIAMSGPIVVSGTVDAPVQMMAQDESWSGLYIARAEKRSLINHLQVSDVGASSVLDTELTGALTFLESDVEIRFSQFRNALAEDFINIHFADLRMEGCYFSQTASDAIDIDFGTFVISQSDFEDITGDGIDFSGSVGELSQVNFSSVGDKAISVGERSEVSIKDASVTNALVALASKDGATVKVDGLKTSNLKLSPVMAYTKKPIFGPAQAYVTGLDTNDQGLAPINQHGSTLVIDNVEYRGIKLDVKALYDGAMKKINVFDN